MIMFLLALWIPSSAIGCLLGLVLFLRARETYLTLKEDEHPDLIDLHLAETIQRREGIKTFVLFCLLLVGLIVLGDRVDVEGPFTDFWPVLLTLAAVTLSWSTVINYIDDRKLRSEIREERQGKEEPYEW